MSDQATIHPVTDAGRGTGGHPSEAGTARRWLRRRRTGLLIGTAFVIAAASALAGTHDSGFTAALDPGNPDPGGARAVARVLAHEGVDVDVVRDADSLEDARIDGDTLVVVTSMDNLGRTTADRLLATVGDAPLLLVDPSVGTLDLFGLEEGTWVTAPRSVPGRCADPSFDRLSIRVDEATAFPDTTGSCFATSDGALLTRPKPGIAVLGAGSLLANDQVTRADNAAVALRLLGDRDHLVWYVPDPADVPAGDGIGLGSLLPRWLGPGLWLAALALLALVGWRGRRLGPLVTEPLPVAVTAIESTESRGRLYRKVSDRAHAAGVLRRAARTRIAEHLRLPRVVAFDPDMLIRHVCAHGGFEPGRVRDLLSPDGTMPRTDKDLTQLANDLAELDREVRRP